MEKSDKAIGILELRGITASIQAADAMVKAADVRVIGTQKIGNALIYIAIEGTVDAVNAAIFAGNGVAERLGEVYAHTVIARPCAEIVQIIGVISK